MDKKILFISYSNDDLDKVELIKKELADHSLLEPLIVANKRAPNKALIDKVTEGITASYRVIAILTQNSINTQWINQEIGYATAKGVKVIPIIEKKIMNDLKGFIHKQNDLPYGFISRQGISARDENKSFMYYFRLLIADLEGEFSPKTDEEKIRFGSKIKKSIDPVSNAVKENFPTSSYLRKPFGTLARSGEKCPETGIWRTKTTPSVAKTISKGTTMPQFKSRNIIWKLIRYS